jgi:hypothetical protein
VADAEPLLFKTGFGGTLLPVTGAAKEAVALIGTGQLVKIKVVKAPGNLKRLAWYWVMLKVALSNLADAFDGPVTTRSLHRWLKRRAGLAKPITAKKSGEIIDYDYDSIAFDKMAEHERAEFIDFARQTLAERLGCDPADLETEARSAA